MYMHIYDAIANLPKYTCDSRGIPGDIPTYAYKQLRIWKYARVRVCLVCEVTNYMYMYMYILYMIQ